MRWPADRRRGVDVDVAEYAEQVATAAAGLASLGVGRGDTVALLMGNRIEFYPLELPRSHLGATSFSVYSTLTAEQMAYLFENAGNTVVLCEARTWTGCAPPASRSSTWWCWTGRSRARSPWSSCMPGRREPRLRLRGDVAGSAGRGCGHADLHLGTTGNPKGWRPPTPT